MNNCLICVKYFLNIFSSKKRKIKDSEESDVVDDSDSEKDDSEKNSVDSDQSSDDFQSIKKDKKG